MRRLILLLSAAVLVLSACGGGSRENELAESSTPSVSATVTTATESPTPSPTPEIRTDYDLPPYSELAKLFDYDTSKPLDYRVVGKEQQKGATVYNVEYQSSGYPVPAYLVIPDGQGPFPAVLFAHGWGVGPDWFVPDAVALAQDGYASLLPEYPGSRDPGVSFTACDARTHVEGNVQYVVDLRRGLNLLETLPEIGAERIGFVGHSLGAGVGGILTGVEGERIDAFVIMDGGAYYSEDMLEDCGNLRDEQLVSYQEGIAVLNAVNYISHDQGAALLFQLSSDAVLPFTEMLLVEFAREPKTLIEYKRYDHYFGCYDLTLCDPSMSPYVDHRAWLQKNV